MSDGKKNIVVSDAFDDLRAPQLRFLEAASERGEVTVLLWPDEMVQAIMGRPPKFPGRERRYFLEAVRYVHRVVPLAGSPADALPDTANIDAWVDMAPSANDARRHFCRDHGLDYCVLTDEQLAGFPESRHSPPEGGRKKVVVTGCYDWFHSGHVRFFEEAASYGDLYVVLGHDANIRALKGEGHPLLPQEERRYVVGAIRFVTRALIATGNGWVDADPEIQQLKPDIYLVNEDGDKGGKREYCAQRGIEYVVLQRAPAPGLPKRSSTDLRGF